MEIENTVKELLQRSEIFKPSQIAKILHLAGDGSGREYSRVYLENAPVRTVILMKLNHAAGPLTSGKDTVQDDTFLELSPFLRKHALPVPEIYVNAQEKAWLLVEDVGDAALWRLVFQDLNADCQVVIDNSDTKLVESLYFQCCDQLKTLQAIKKDYSSVAFKRSMSYQVYRDEIERFVNFYVIPKGFPENTIPVFRKAFDTLCESIVSHPEVLVYRDFMAWNIHVTPEGKLRLIDFQDTLSGSDAYDLMSLMHDRDIDLQTGRDFIEKIIEYYIQAVSPVDDFKNRYAEVLLQRHFRLSGQFDMLSEKFGREIYRSWIPGCFNRIGQVTGKFDYFSDAASILYERVPEFKKGFDNPWSFL